MAEFLFNGPVAKAVAVTPDDANDLAAGATRALYIGGAGNIVVIMRDERRYGGTNTVTFTGVPAGTILPISVARVAATLTTATAIIALY